VPFHQFTEGRFPWPLYVVKDPLRRLLMVAGLRFHPEGKISAKKIYALSSFPKSPAIRLERVVSLRR
jgi:hypothetical protein